jgi:carbon storage regulator
MLVLSRKINESIMVGDNVTIVVVEIRGDKVRLGIEAPKDVPVHRREVYNAIKANEAKIEKDGIEHTPLKDQNNYGYADRKHDGN